jgi:hypothetical protein
LCYYLPPPNQLSGVLDKLLPKILPLAADPLLREGVSALVSQIMRRVTPLRTLLPCAVLLSELVRADTNPFVCNLALTFLDGGLGQETDPLRRAACADALLCALQSFAATPLCPQTGALCSYAAALLDLLPEAFLRAGAPAASAALLQDWMLDVALSRPGMQAVSFSLWITFVHCAVLYCIVLFFMSIYSSVYT